MAVCPKDFKLPQPPKPLPGAAYTPAFRVPSGAVVIEVSGMLANPEKWRGKRLDDATASIEEAIEAAKEAMLLSITAANVEMNFDEDFVGAVVVVLVASGPNFEEHPVIANGATAMLTEKGLRVARAAYGVSSLPKGTLVEVKATFYVK